MDWKGLFREWRVWLLILFLLISLVALRPHYVQKGGKTSIGTALKYGLDLKGGSRVLVKPEGNVTGKVIDTIIDTLQTRINAFGLKEIVIRPVRSLNEFYVQLDVAEANSSEIKKLIEKEGKFEARIPIPVKNNGVLRLGSKNYIVHVKNNSIEVQNKSYKINETFKLSSGSKEIELTFINISDGKAVLSALAFSGLDIKQILTDVQHSRIFPQGDGWRFQFQVIITKESAERFKDICQALNIKALETRAGKSYLSSNLELYLDNKLMDSLRIGAEFKKDVVTSPSISGGSTSKEGASNQMKTLQSILRSGRLPVPIKVVSVSTISPSLGVYFIRTALLSILVAILAVGIVIFLRYKDPKIVLPVMITGLSEVTIILGIASLISWTIDLPAIAGIIAAVGTGVDDQIVITDERSREEKEVRSIKARLKRAFFIIFTAFFTTVGAMFPLTFVGAGTVKGFAITTIIGVTIGVLVTRPAYAKILEHLE